MTDYFAFYGLPLSFDPDIALVKQKFYELSKKYHPDFYINESEEKQLEVLELSTVNNKAYQVLSDPQKRLQYILEFSDLVKRGENYVLPQSFLMDMMDINEALMDLQFDPDLKKLEELKEQVNRVEKDLSEDISSLTAAFDSLNADEQEKMLLAVKDLYYRSKYLVRLREGIVKAASTH